MGDLKFNRKIIFKGAELKAEELAGQIAPDDRKQALGYVWSQPVSTIVSGMDTEQFLEANAGLAQAFKPMSQTEQARGA